MSQPVSPSAYQPPTDSIAILGTIVQQLKSSTPIDSGQFTGHSANYIGILPGGQLYFEVKTMDIDDDGGTAGSPSDWTPIPVRGGTVDHSHQAQTSYGSRFPQPPGQTDFISAFQEPYIVLPGGRPLWFAKFHIGIGDGAVVIRGGQRIDVVFADTGPGNKIGEMSIKAHQLFGVDTFKPGFRPRMGTDGQPQRDPQTNKLLVDPATVTKNQATVGPFIVIVFPHSSVGNKFVSVDSSLKAVIDQQFNALASAPVQQ